MSFKFEALKDKNRKVFVDTDIGPDCDDAGALSLLFYYAKLYGTDIIGIVNCTSNIYGSGCIKAIAGYYGFNGIPVGITEKKNYLDDDSCKKYNKFVTENFSKYIDDSEVTTAAELYRRSFACAEDDSVMLITIGPFNALCEFMKSGPDDISPLSGIELMRKKVYAVVSMAGLYPSGREYNIVCDALSAQYVFENMPVPVVLSDFKVGLTIRTGFENKYMDDNPVYHAYSLYRKPGAPVNASFDLTAVQFAFEGEGEYYEMSKALTLKVYPDKDGADEFVFDDNASMYMMIKKQSDETYIKLYNQIIQRS